MSHILEEHILYLRVGYYPFYDGSEVEYYTRIENVVTYIIEQEMPMFCGIDPAYTRKLKAMMMFLTSTKRQHSYSVGLEVDEVRESPIKVSL